jgi:ferric-dicitrate binding protein FerR (iron transport regulator)
MDIYDILCRYIEGNVDSGEKRQVILWLEENPEHVQEYLKLRKLYNLQLWNMEKPAETGISPAIPEVSDGRPSYKLYPDILKIAVSLLIGILGTLFIVNREPEEELMTQTIRVPAGQRAELLLSDGTEVWLNSGSTLVYPEKFSKTARELKLNGEGYFKVTKNREKPFTVKTSQYSLHVLGTEFNVKAYSKSNAFEAALLNGSIEIASSSGDERIRMAPDEQVSLYDGMLVKGAIDDYNYFKWREGLLCIENESIASLFAKLELYYDVKIDVKKASLLNYVYTGKFRVRDGVEHVLRVLQLKHEFRYTKNEELNLVVIE